MDHSARNEDDSPFHEGERLVHARVGVAHKVEEMGRRMLRDHLIQQHVDFYPLLPLIFVGALDDEERIWATVLFGQPGFVHAVDPRRLRLESLPGSGDPLHGRLAVGKRVGILGLELQTRRRNRLNGGIAQVDAGGFEIAVQQSFGNCPKYIQTRVLRERADRGAQRLSTSSTIDDRGRRIVERADTLFIASIFGNEPSDRRLGADISHRGGPCGFVRFDTRGRIVIPDYVGNNAFQTFGNVVLDRRVGLLFLDFDDGTILQLTGTAEIDWDGPEIVEFPGAKRLLRVSIQQMVRRESASPLLGEFLEWSPVLP